MNNPDQLMRIGEFGSIKHATRGATNTRFPLNSTPSTALIVCFNNCNVNCIITSDSDFEKYSHLTCADSFISV